MSQSEDYSTESQKKVYTIWANNILNKRNLHITDLFEDLRDGVYLINILEILTSEKSENYIVKPKNRLQQLSNVQLALNVIDRWGISLVNCRPEHLVDKNSKMILSLIWRLISKFQIQQFLTDEDFGLFDNNSSNNDHPSELMRSFSGMIPTVSSRTSTNIGKPTVTAKEALLRWCRREIESYTNATSITNFSKSFQSPQLFYCLVHKYCPDSIGDLESISKQDEVEALNKCFDIAEKQLGIPKFLTPQNIIEGPIDEYCVMTYISYFLNYHRNQLQPQTIAITTTTTTTITATAPTTFTKGHQRVSSTGSNNSNASTISNDLNVLPTVTTSTPIVSSLSTSFTTAGLPSSTTVATIATPPVPTQSVSKKRASISVNTNVTNNNNNNSSNNNNNNNNNNSNNNNNNNSNNNSNNASGAKTPSLLSTPEKLTFTSPTNSPSLFNDNRVSTSPRPQNKQSPQSPQQTVQNPQQQQQSQQIIEIINNFTLELKRFSERHEKMLIRTAAILDEKVNRLGDKLDQLETKISSMKTVISSITENHQCSHHHHHGNSNNISEINSPFLDKRIQSLVSSPISSPSMTPTSPMTPPPNATTTTTTTTTASNVPRKETQQEKDERREKRRSRRKEKEERRQQRNATLKNNNNTINNNLDLHGTLTQSSSSCSLVDEAHDREEIKKIIKSQSLVRGYLVRKQYKRIKNRREVAQEILKTEETYVNSLTVLFNEYLVPLKNESAGISSISADNVKTLNNNINVILNMNNMLLKKLRERMSTPWHYRQLFGDIFFKMSDLLKCYIAYVNHYNRALSTVNDFTKHTGLNEMINATFVRTHQQLRDLIIIPVQRIPRYVLLLEEMCKVTETSHPDHQQLSQSLTKMQSIADHVNEKRRDFENVIHVSLLQEAITGFNIMEYSSLRYIMEGDLQAHIMSGGSGFGTAIAGVVGNAVSGTNGSGGSGLNGGSGSNSSGGSGGGSGDLGKGITTPLHVFLFNQMMVVCKYKKGKDSYFANKTLFGNVNNEKHKSKQPKYKYLSHHLLTSNTKLSSNKSENWFGIDNGSDYKRFFARTVAEKDMWVQHIQPCIDKATEIKTLKDNKK
ncbi:hypothetical protein RB653_004342 [Dictyostelium firmibasis]|uniref:RhoGEF domain-containing protein n=1 Tax=Dictyostelium firmibasis TaxID=79012 RepID=A0AAN7YXW9_9MYCE